MDKPIPYPPTIFMKDFSAKSAALTRMMRLTEAMTEGERRHAKELRQPTHLRQYAEALTGAVQALEEVMTTLVAYQETKVRKGLDEAMVDPYVNVILLQLHHTRNLLGHMGFDIHPAIHEVNR